MNETDTTLRRCAGTPELSCHEELAGEHRNRVRCHRCSVEYNNARRRAQRAGVPFGIPKEQLQLPIILAEPAQQRTF